MGELNKSFKPETMRLFVKLDEDGKYHEVDGLNGFSIEEEYNLCNNSDVTITIKGFNTHVGDDPFEIDREADKKNRGYDYVANYTGTYSADAPIFFAGPSLYFKPLSKRESYKEHLPKKVIVSGPCVISFWDDGTKTISRCHDGDEMDVRTGILLNAIKKWMPGGTYWQDVMDDVTVEYQGKKENVEPNFKCPDGLEVIGHGKIVHKPVNHDHPKRSYQRGMSYNDDEKLSALEMMQHMSVAEVSKKTGISLSCLYRWRDAFRGSNG